MSKRGKIDALRRLANWFENKHRVLPWRDDPSVYRVWISEIMLQQTQVITVVPYFEKFVRRFPTVESLAMAREEEVLLYWAGLGYYSRARNIHKTAQLVCEAGAFPENREGWLRMPGVGEYTAGAILSIAGGKPEAILDGNVERVLSRVYCLSRKPSDSKYKDTLWDFSREWVSEAFSMEISPRVLNQALMELGATVCTPKKPLCGICPLQKFCAAFSEEKQTQFPEKKQPKEWIQVLETLHCVIDLTGHVLVEQRPKGAWRAGLWDLLSARPAGLKLRSVGEIETRHVVTRHKITRTTKIWITQALKVPVGMHWCSMSDPKVAVGSAFKRTVQSIRERFPAVEPQS